MINFVAGNGLKTQRSCCCYKARQRQRPITCYRNGGLFVLTGASGPV
jgi:hypothetical protein